MDRPWGEFALTLTLGSSVTLINLAIQLWAIKHMLAYIGHRDNSDILQGDQRHEIRVLAICLGFLFLGHLLQFASWAVLFLLIGEFQSISVAFYHSAVNFTSLGYGDIVMSERWRLLGPLEAANGILMLGLTAGVVLSVMSEFKGRRAQQALVTSPGAKADARADDA